MFETETKIQISREDTNFKLYTTELLFTNLKARQFEFCIYDLEVKANPVNME